jgi:hypothetical protein
MVVDKIYLNVWLQIYVAAYNPTYYQINFLHFANNVAW